jgi:WD40 repeat protein/serine/threonine protein kinase
MTQPVPIAGQSGSAEDGLVAIIEELTTRLQAGERVDVEPYIRAHPEQAERLRNVVPALGVLAELGQAPLPEEAPETTSQSLLGELGDFRILREVGRGGMGVVYEAEQVSLGRRVALKVLPFASTLDAKQLQRFKNEAQAAAHLHHQNIVPVHATGCERGVHYYAMQFIDGHTLAAMIAELRRLAGREAAESSRPAGPAADLASEMACGRWAPARRGAAVGQLTGPYPGPAEPPAAPANDTGPQAATDSTLRSTTEPAYFRSVAQLGIEAAEALEHAHLMEVIHRDIKPGNLLMDGRGKLWVTDFGLAHCQSQAGLTMTGDLVGTLRYMSPEQALAKRVAVDQRTDVYSLGATLYELLALEPAFRGSDRQELLRQIAFEDPRPLRQNNKAVPAELDTIVRKAMEKSPADRYATAQELADDLRRFLDDRPIRARRPTLLQVARKWARRHRGVALTAGFAGLLVLALAIVGLGVNNVLLRREEARTQAANQELRSSLYYQTIALAEREHTSGNVARAEQLLDEQCPHDLRGWEWRYLKRLRYGNPPPLYHSSFLWGVALSRDGRLLAAGSDDGILTLWDTQSWEEVRHFRVHEGRFDVAFGPDGQHLATLNMTGTVQIWDVATGAMLHTLTHDGHGNIAFSPDGRWIVSGAQTEVGEVAVKIWDAASGQLLRALPGHDVGDGCSLAFSPDGRCLAVGTAGRLVKLWDTAAWTELRTLEPPAGGQILGLSFRPDGAQLAVACGTLEWQGSEGEVSIWDVATGQPVRSLRGHIGGAFAVAFAPDGKRLASSGVEDATIKLWDVEAGREALTLRMPADGVSGLAFSPDGHRLYSAGADQAVRAWDATPLGQGIQPGVRTLHGHAGPVACVAFSPDNRRLVAGTMDGKVKVWDVLTAQEISTLTAHTGPVRGLAFRPDGLQLASVSARPNEAAEDATGEVKLWDTKTWREIPSPGLKGGRLNLGVTFRPDGRRLAVAEGFTIAVWDPAARKRIRSLKAPNTFLAIAVAFGPSDHLAASGLQGSIQVWDLSVPQEVGPFAALVPPPPGLGRLVDVWYATTALPVHTLPAHRSRAMSVAFSPEGKYLASAGLDGAIRLWDARTFRPVDKPLRGHLDGIHSLAFRPDGKRLASAGGDAMIQIWDLATRLPVLTLHGHTDKIAAVAYSPDGRYLASGSWDKTVKIWDAALLPEARRRVAAGPDD